MAETEVKSINGRTLADVTARARIEEIKNAAPGLVFDTVADMEAYIAENADTLKVGQDLFIREADVPDYWWDGTAAVPVETELGEVKEQLNELSEAIVEQGKTIPKVFDWALAELPFTESEISDTASGAGFVVNPTNFADGKTYFRYHAGATSFTWTNPNPQKGAVTITARGISQWGGTGGTRLLTIYDDGTYGPALYIVVNGESQTSTVTTDPEKTLAKITGNYDLENWILLDMDVMSIVADYSMPTDLGITGAVVGQTVKITEVDENGKPTKWEAVELPDGVSSWNDLTDKPFGKEGEADYLVSPVDVHFVQGDAYPDEPITVDPAYFATGSTLYVVWDGVAYEQTVKYHNMAMYNYIGGDDVPFTINDIDGTGELTIRETSSYTGTINFALAKSLETVKTLDPTYLPIDNEISETGEGLLRNKTVAKALRGFSANAGDSAVLYTVQSKTYNEKMQARANLDLYRQSDEHPVVAKFSNFGWWECSENHGYLDDANMDQTYDVEIAGHGIYNCVPHIKENYDYGTDETTHYAIIGNPALCPIEFDYDGSEYPFAVWQINGVWNIAVDSTLGLGMGSVITVRDAFNTQTVITPVPKEFIPVLDEIILISTDGNGKLFRVTVDDTGALSATEITE